jgi:hypothetical protein
MVDSWKATAVRTIDLAFHAGEGAQSVSALGSSGVPTETEASMRPDVPQQPAAEAHIDFWANVSDAPEGCSERSVTIEAGVILREPVSLEGQVADTVCFRVAMSNVVEEMVPGNAQTLELPNRVGRASVTFEYLGKRSETDGMLALFSANRCMLGAVRLGGRVTKR